MAAVVAAGCAARNVWGRLFTNDAPVRLGWSYNFKTSRVHHEEGCLLFAMLCSTCVVLGPKACHAARAQPESLVNFRTGH